MYKHNKIHKAESLRYRMVSDVFKKSRINFFKYIFVFLEDYISIKGDHFFKKKDRKPSS